MNKKNILLLALVLLVIVIGGVIAVHSHNAVTSSNSEDKRYAVATQAETKNWGLCEPSSSVTQINKTGSDNESTELGFERVDDTWSRLFVPFYNYKVKGYCMKYPSNWKISLAGAEHLTTDFNRDNNSSTTPEFNFETISSSLPLESSDNVVYRYEDSSSPLVGSNEVVVSKQTKQIGDNKALVLITKDNNIFYLRLFVKNDTTLHMLEKTFSPDEYDSSIYTNFLTTAYEMISSLRPLGS
ncbi:hypothetical protein BH11PAT2_BH11PAT2_00390 [soil metagenome]